MKFIRYVEIACLLFAAIVFAAPAATAQGKGRGHGGGGDRGGGRQAKGDRGDRGNFGRRSGGNDQGRGKVQRRGGDEAQRIRQRFERPMLSREQNRGNDRQARAEQRGRQRGQAGSTRGSDPWFRQQVFVRDQERSRGRKSERNEREVRIRDLRGDERRADRGVDPWYRQRDVIKQTDRRRQDIYRDRIFSQRRDNTRVIYQDRQRGRDNDYYDRDYDRNNREYRNRSGWIFAPYGYKNYGQYRSAQVHRRNEARKWARDYGSFWGRNYDYDRDDRYDRNWRRRAWRDNVVRNVIVDPWYYAGYDRYYPVRRYRADNFRLYVSYSTYRPYSYGYRNYDPYYDRYVSYDPYSRYQQYPNYGYADYYDPYYSNANYADPYYQPYYRTSPYRAIGSAIGALPIAEILYQVTGNGVASEIVSGFLSQAYNQGYEAGRYARRQGYADRYYDPYDCGYGYSANLAENRRIFSEGYSLGYRDAVERRSGYEPYLDRSPDLVSMFVGLSL